MAIPVASMTCWPSLEDHRLVFAVWPIPFLITSTFAALKGSQFYFYFIHFLLKDSLRYNVSCLTPAPRLRYTRASHDSQYTRFPIVMPWRIRFPRGLFHYGIVFLQWSHLLCSLPFVWLILVGWIPYWERASKSVVRKMIWAASWENQQRGFRTGSTQISLYSHRSRLEAWNFGFMKKRKCTIRVWKTKALTSAPLFSHMQIVGFLMRRLILPRLVPPPPYQFLLWSA